MFDIYPGKYSLISCFSSFSDRFLLNALLTGRPENCRMTFLTPVDERLPNLIPLVYSSWISLGVGVFFFAIWTPFVFQPSMRRSDKKDIKKVLGERVITVTTRSNECSAIPLELTPKLCAILYPSTANYEKEKRLLMRVACEMNLKPVFISPVDRIDKARRKQFIKEGIVERLPDAS